MKEFHGNLPMGIQDSTSVLSHHKLNRSNWIADSVPWICSLYCEKASKIGLFSKVVALRICRILCKLRSRRSCFLRMATRTYTLMATHTCVFTAFSLVP